GQRHVAAVGGEQVVHLHRAAGLEVQRQGFGARRAVVDAGGDRDGAVEAAGVGQDAQRLVAADGGEVEVGAGVPGEVAVLGGAGAAGGERDGGDRGLLQLGKDVADADNGGGGVGGEGGLAAALREGDVGSRRRRHRRVVGH